MKPLGFRSIMKEENSADKMPKKTIRKWKRKARQTDKRVIVKELKNADPK